MRRYVSILIWLWCLGVIAGEFIPPAPDYYFNDYAHVVDPATAQQLNTKLENLEKSSSDQVVVAIYPKMQSDSSIDDYTLRVARAWKVGQKQNNNGVALFVFVQDRKMFIQVGYGLEGALPDAICKQITEYEIKPHFKTGDYTGGLVAGVNSIIAAIRHEYAGNGRTVSMAQPQGGGDMTAFVALLIPILLIILALAAVASTRRKHGWIIGSGGWSGYTGSGGWGSGGWGGGGWGGGGGGGGGGFSGGGGSFGGGGAGSSW